MSPHLRRLRLPPARAAGMASLLMLNACASLGPDYPAPELAVPTRWQLEADTRPSALATWWQHFNDPALDALIAAALKSNANLRETAARLREAQAQRQSSGAALLPTLSANASLRGNALGNAIGDTRVDSRQGSLDAGWEIDLWGEARRSVEAAEANLAASAADLAASRVSLVAETALAYFELRALEARIEATTTRVQAQDTTLELTRLRQRAGLANSLELAQAESNAAQSRAQLPALDKSLGATRTRLNRLLGRMPAPLPELALGPGRLPAAPATLAVGIPAQTLRQRPDVAAAEQRLLAANAEVGVAAAARYPSLAISASIGVDALSIGRAFDPAFWLSSAAASLAAPLFDGGRRAAAQTAAEARREQALIRYEATLRQALGEVEDALLAWQRDSLRVGELKTAEEAALQAAALAEMGYRVGSENYLTLLEAQRSALNTQDQRISAELDRISNLVRLYKALGGGWEAPQTPPAGALAQ